MGMLSLAFSLLFVSCGKEHWMTTKVCNGALFVENFRVNGLLGIYTNYLTDSTNFRIYIGQFDPEQTAYFYACKGDSIIVEKYDKGRELGYAKQETLWTKVYSLEDLRRKGRLK
jgi:hypothetical protein